jgi:hypothetical protein
MPPVNEDPTPLRSLLDELVTLSEQKRDDLAMRLLQINALLAVGEITDEEFTARRAAIFAT